MHIAGELLTMGGGVFLLLALGLALSFEFVNGFHDTANAVATVIYTHTLRPRLAVVWSGCWNLIGVLTSTGVIAFSIVALLPVELVTNVGSGAGFAMVFALLLSAIIWNLGTWHLGLPASSSHTLIGAILGVGLGNSLLAPHAVFGEGVNWAKAREVGASLLISPVIGFCFAALLLLLAKAMIKRPDLYRAPIKEEKPPLWIRGVLVLTCTGVSFAHGSNDGQKGMGLIMLILIGILPGAYALNLGASSADVAQLGSSAVVACSILDRQTSVKNLTAQQADDEMSSFLKTGRLTDRTLAAVSSKSHAIAGRLAGIKSFRDLSADERRSFRSAIYLTNEALVKLQMSNTFRGKEVQAIANYRTQMESATRFIPDWVKFAVAFALGLGTMIGWKRIVVTVGEKIGKEHLTYAQGAAAELVAMGTIGASDYLGLPVSTTHVLSSGVAGTMAANGSGIQVGTLRNLMLAWVLTLPVCVVLGATLFAAGLYIVLNILGLK